VYTFTHLSQVIPIWIRTIRSFAWGQKSSPRRFYLCPSWSCKFVLPTIRKLFDL